MHLVQNCQESGATVAAPILQKRVGSGSAKEELLEKKCSGEETTHEEEEETLTIPCEVTRWDFNVETRIEVDFVPATLLSKSSLL
jgi:hypothetical protein